MTYEMIAVALVVFSLMDFCGHAIKARLSTSRQVAETPQAAVLDWLKRTQAEPVSVRPPVQCVDSESFSDYYDRMNRFEYDQAQALARQQYERQRHDLEFRSRYDFTVDLSNGHIVNRGTGRKPLKTDNG